MKNTPFLKSHDLFAHARDEAEITSLLNTDIYKFLMLDFILADETYKNIPVKREMKIRSKDVKTANIIPQDALREQLDACMNIQGISPVESAYLGGLKNDKNNGLPLFKKETLEFLSNFRLPQYNIGDDGHGNYTLSFTGTRAESTLREIYGLKIINSLYAYYYTKKAKYTHSEFGEIITRSLARLFDDIEIFKSEPGITFSEFGTRRALSSDYHKIVYDILHERLPKQCIGTSNVKLALESGDTNPRGTNAHELRMIPTALSDNPQEIIDTMYNVDRQWMKHFPGLGILLPDTYGSSFYFKNAPQDIVDQHSGVRFDSKDPKLAIPEYIAFLKKHNKTPMNYVGIPSDGLTAKTTKDIIQLFGKEILLTFGNGTHLTNNTKGVAPRELPGLPFGSFSVVVKPTEVQRPNGERVSTVKLSDNFEKAMGAPERVAFFKKIFGSIGMQSLEVLV